MRALLFLTNQRDKDRSDWIQAAEKIGYTIAQEDILYSVKYDQSIQDKEKTDQRKKAFKSDIEAAIQKAKANNQFLIINSFEALEKNINSIDLLKESEVKFHILDFPNLNQNNISLLSQLLSYQSELKGKKISEGLQERRKGGGVIGNPAIASEKNINKATYRRKELAYTNEINTRARIKIEALKNNDRLNFNQIANYLNDANLTTRRGGRFHAKGVERLYQMHLEIKDRFAKDENQEPLIDVLRKTDDHPDVVTQIYNYKNYKDEISFKLNEINQEDAQIIIRDNKGVVVYEEKLTREDVEVNIEVAQALLLPGIYYLEITYQEEKEESRIYRAFYIKKEVEKGA